jgi:hypothetical protein
MAAERLGIPWVQVTMTALTIPSADAYPGLLPLPAGRAPRLANRASWAAIELVTRLLADGWVNDVRRRLELPPTPNATGCGGHSRHLTAVAISPVVPRHQPDWPSYVATNRVLLLGRPCDVAQFEPWRRRRDRTTRCPRRPAVDRRRRWATGRCTKSSTVCWGPESRCGPGSECCRWVRARIFAGPSAYH